MFLLWGQGTYVDLDTLSRVDFVGGKIKNILLNAARLAFRRDKAGAVKMDDFLAASAMEEDGSWNRTARTRIGFGSTGTRQGNT